MTSLAENAGEPDGTGLEQDRVRFRRERLPRFRAELRRDEDLREDPGYPLGELTVHGTIQRHDPPERGDRIRGQGLLVGLLYGLTDRRAARVCVLDDDGRR